MKKRIPAKKPRKKRKDRQKQGGFSLIFMLVCAALITVGAVLLFFSLFAVYKVYDIPMIIDISDHSGFNTDTDMVNFGKAVPGNSNTRIIVMSHDYRKPLLIQFKKSGNISDFVDVPESFYLDPGLTKEISLNAVIPESAAEGTYTGNLRVYFRRI
jgi:hypothetical protein